jgi:hypothetical protein
MRSKAKTPGGSKARIGLLLSCIEEERCRIMQGVKGRYIEYI